MCIRDSHRAAEVEEVSSFQAEQICVSRNRACATGRACDLRAASHVGHRGKTRAPSKLRNLCTTEGGARGSQTHSVSSSPSVARPNSKATLQPSWHERTSPRTLVFLCDSVPLWPVFPVPILLGIRQYPSPFVSIRPSADRPIFAVWAMEQVAKRIASNF